MSDKYENICNNILNSFDSPSAYSKWEKEKQNSIKNNRKWENTTGFIDWVIFKKVKAMLKRKDLIGKVPKGDCASNDNMAFKNASINLDTIESMLNGKVLEHLNTYFFNTQIDIWHINTFIHVAEAVKFFEQSKFSTDATEFKREINQLKKQADKLQSFSSKHIIIRLPQLPQNVIYPMIQRFKRYGLDEDQIRYFYEFFADRKRLPKKTKSYLEQLELWDKIVYDEKIKDVTLGEKMAFDAIHFYSPNIELRFNNAFLRYGDL